MESPEPPVEKKEEPLDLTVRQMKHEPLLEPLPQRNIPDYSPPPYSGYPPLKRMVSAQLPEWSDQLDPATSQPPLTTTALPMTRHVSFLRMTFFSPAQAIITNQQALPPLTLPPTIDKVHYLFQPLMQDSSIVNVFSARLLAVQTVYSNPHILSPPHPTNYIPRPNFAQAAPQPLTQLSPPVLASAAAPRGYLFHPGPSRWSTSVQSQYGTAQQQRNYAYGYPQTSQVDQQQNIVPFTSVQASQNAGVQSLIGVQRKQVAISQSGGGFMTSSNSTATIRPRLRTPAVRKNSVAIVKRPETNRRRLSTPLQQPVVEKEVKKPLRRVVAVKSTYQIPPEEAESAGKDPTAEKEQEMQERATPKRKRSRRDSLWDLFPEDEHATTNKEVERRESEKKRTVSNHVKFSLINHIEKRRLPKVSTDRGCHVGYVEQELLEMVTPNPMFLEDDVFHPEWPLQKMLDAWEAKTPIPVRTKEPWKDFIDGLFQEVEDEIQRSALFKS